MSDGNLDLMDTARHERRALLVVGHPGHELRIYGWVAQIKPVVCILTDGSGSAGRSRLDESRTLLGPLGAQCGSLFGEFTDRHLYACILDKQYDVFESIHARLVGVLESGDFGMVVSDAAEGYNPIHDLCEVLVHAAVKVANRTRPGSIEHYVIPLMEDPQVPTDDSPCAFKTVELNEIQLQRKVSAAREYADRVGEPLRQETEDTFFRFGTETFANEKLFVAAHDRDPESRFNCEKPFYESYGVKQVLAGRYQSVIRFREHILPLMTRILEKGSGA